MLKNIIPRHTEEHTEYHIEFTNEERGGFSFDADKNGNIILTNDDQRANYQYAMEHPKEFTVQFNEFVKRKFTYTVPAVGTCSCGNTVTLENEYQGACQCDKCGQWYNLFGQELIPPEYWED